MDTKLELVQKSHAAQENAPAKKRILALFDEGTFVEIDSLAKSGEGQAEVVAGFGSVNGSPVYAFSQNSQIAGGAMSKAQAAKIKKIYDLAVKTGAPVVGIFDSNGGRLKEGNEMLAAYGELLLQSNNLSGVVPQISVIVGACVGTSAMIAAGADFVVLAKDAVFGVAVNGSDETAEEAAKSGTAHIVAENAEEAVVAARTLVSMLPSNNLEAPLMCEFAEPENSAAVLNAAAAKLEADASAAVAAEIAAAVADAGSAIELLKDFGTGVLCELATVGGSVCGLIVSDSGVIDAAACEKAARFVRFCDAFAIPVITMVNSTGFASLREASMLSHAYAEATTAKISIVTGAAYGSAFIAMAGRAANADLTVAWPSAVISALEPKAAVAILCEDQLAAMTDPKTQRDEIVRKYMDTEASPFAAAESGFIEDVIAPAETRACLINALDMLAGKRVSRLPKKHSNIQL
ncbi:MAG: carboxyl transferase domain-containing protein [Firmicutes bacterium]|nr:carboxyl transferase domain-containing protein [Bacillota bacterium]